MAALAGAGCRPRGAGVRGLDTPVLLGLLRGDARVSAFLRRAEAEDLCTTVINLFELEAIARSDRAPGRERRLSSLERLRRKVTVLPIDERATELSAQEASRAEAPAAPPSTWLILGALLSGGCSEWITTREARFPSAAGLKVTLLDRSTTKV
jgi:predicted nucleic acid-binding protein